MFGFFKPKPDQTIQFAAALLTDANINTPDPRANLEMCSSPDQFDWNVKTKDRYQKSLDTNYQPRYKRRNKRNHKRRYH